MTYRHGINIDRRIPCDAKIAVAGGDLHIGGWIPLIPDRSHSSAGERFAITGIIGKSHPDLQVFAQVYRPHYVGVQCRIWYVSFHAAVDGHPLVAERRSTQSIGVGNI